MRRVLEKLGHSQGKCTTVLCDNRSTIKLSKNPVMHGCNKHIDVRFHFLRDLTKDGVVELKHRVTQEQVTDIVTKPLKLDVFLKLRESMGVCVVPRVNWKHYCNQFRGGIVGVVKVIVEVVKSSFS